MPKAEREIKVIIVDDRLDDALRYASRLSHISEGLVGGRLCIEISNNAYFVARKILEGSPDEPPWDVVISDVHMPVPDSVDSPGIPQARAKEELRGWDGKKWKVYFWQQHDETHTDAWKHGGLYIARQLEARVGEVNEVKPKLVLVSRPLRGTNRSIVQEMVGRNRSWLDYIDKDRWEAEPLADERHLSDENMFVWALLDSLRRIDRADWGHASSIPRSGDEDRDLVPSGKMRQAINRGRQLVQHKAEFLLICGEEGSGRTAVARILADEGRAVHGNQDLPCEEVDCSSVSAHGDEFGRSLAASIERAGDGVLILDDVDRLAPPFQAKILTFIKRRRFRARETEEELECRACLIICVTRNVDSLQALAEEGMFDLRLFEYFSGREVVVPPIREREVDFPALVLRAVRVTGHSEGIDDAAIQKLWERPWKRNVSELFGFVRSRCAVVSWRKLGVEDLLDDGDSEGALPSFEGGPIKSLEVVFRLGSGKSSVELSSEELPGMSGKFDKLTPRGVTVFLLLAAERVANGHQRPGATKPFGPQELWESSGAQWEKWVVDGSIPESFGGVQPDLTTFAQDRTTAITDKWSVIERTPICRHVLEYLRKGRKGRKGGYIYQLNALKVTVSFSPEQP